MRKRNRHHGHDKGGGYEREGRYDAHVVHGESGRGTWDDREPSREPGWGHAVGHDRHARESWPRQRTYGHEHGAWTPMPPPERREDFAHRPPPSRGPKGWTRSDERIRDDVCERIMAAGIDASDVEVTVQDGEVVLVGNVSRRDVKRRIEDIADGVMGVRDVHNQIRTRPPA